MAGIPIKLVGRAGLRFEIGPIQLDHHVYFTDAACIPETADSYNIIMGNDLLSRLPTWTIDYHRRAFHFTGHAGNLPCSAPPLSQSTATPITVRVAETTVLQPQTETFVTCITDSTPASSIVLSSQSDNLLDKNIMISPAVLVPGKVQLLATNPSCVAEVLYKGQKIATASPLLENDDHTLAVSPRWF
ncbi:unnamed protein product [Cylicostephanus goldi]|uniref:Uncharacterized protein n=1 Tax=Cylicostephanus goldi TaxID=71465 RepID=A0A3P6TVR2_CYLGO|nr:unnamed protein product [Cylicostephanus goldi]